LLIVSLTLPSGQTLKSGNTRTKKPIGGGLRDSQRRQGCLLLTYQDQKQGNQEKERGSLVLPADFKPYGDGFAKKNIF
jgi:hypothetical protein